LKRGERGSELLEFSLIMLPLFAMIAVTVDMSWAIFAQGSLTWAVRYAVHQGVNYPALLPLANGACLTDTVKSLVQQNSVGLLSGSSGLAMIKVNYFAPPSADSGGASTDVSTQSTGDAPGNIMQVSVQNYSLIPLLPRFFSWNQSADKNPTNISVYAADLIESDGGTIPCIGTAP
jgi:Flp pilus assembly protein TadG